MRLAPIPIFYRNQPQEAIEMSGESSKTTHPLQVNIDACKYFGGLIYGALNGIDKEELLSDCYSPIDGYWNDNEMHDEISTIASGSFKDKNPPEIEGSGYVVKSLEASLWAFYNSNSYEEGVFKAVNLGDDADTTGAIYGQLAGAYYGFNDIPPKFINQIAMKEMLTSFSNKLNNSKISMTLL